MSYLTRRLLTLQLFKNSIDTQEKLSLNLHSLSVSELLEYGRKTMVISTSQLSRVHSLDSGDIGLAISEIPVVRVRKFKLLRVYLTEHLKWDKHISYLLTSSYMGHYA